MLIIFYFCPKNNLPYRYFIELSFKGTNYHGWQVQPNASTVQELLGNALSALLREKPDITGAGRTDAGVHAEQFIAHFDCSLKGLDRDKNLVFRLNRILPRDIAIKKIFQVHPRAHSRFDAISRTYKYKIAREKNPFIYDLSWYIYGDMDMEKMNSAAALMKNYTDFTSFSKLHSGTKTTNCRIMVARWEQEGDCLVFTIRANRFLRNMVRALVGTMIEVGREKMSVEDFCSIIEKKDRSLAKASAPAKGLFLTSIEYPGRILYGSRCEK